MQVEKFEFTSTRTTNFLCVEVQAAAAQQHFVKSKLLVSYNSLKHHHGLPMFELRGLTGTQRKFTESKLNENILIYLYHFRELNSQV